ncbi:hypothetical protein BKA80DRAFT_278689 [Phyllosticta citrichinensis]
MTTLPSRGRRVGYPCRSWFGWAGGRRDELDKRRGQGALGWTLALIGGRTALRGVVLLLLWALIHQSVSQSVRHRLGCAALDGATWLTDDGGPNTAVVCLPSSLPLLIGADRPNLCLRLRLRGPTGEELAHRTACENSRRNVELRVAAGENGS